MRINKGVCMAERWDWFPRTVSVLFVLYVFIYFTVFIILFTNDAINSTEII
jgi:phage shock protein PspC (stress-responsive transcriptional regulator)